ncbi:MAG: GspH/FimT family pseudopilin [Desulfobacterales bacterium]|nr:GspH/FimT family pseudopilin [Desulfobacterales bacterium]
MRCKSGFTLIELLIVVAIFAIFATIGTPAFIHWRNNASLRGNANNLKADLELAKLRAMQENTSVSLIFDNNYRGYEVRINGGNTIQKVSMTGGVKVNTLPAALSDTIQFNGRGLSADIATTQTVTIVNSRNDEKKIIVNRLGHISFPE